MIKELQSNRFKPLMKTAKGEKDMRAVMTPVATPRAKDPLKTPRKMPKDFNKAMASKLWLLSPVGWYATMELRDRRTKSNHCFYKEKGNRHSESTKRKWSNVYHMLT